MKKKNRVLLLIALFIIILLILIIIVDIQASKKKKEAEKTNEATYFEDSSTDKLASMSEKERIIFYFSKYIENIENEDYKTAYTMLYDEFKNTYFDTIDKFETYIREKYPEIISVEYLEFRREGKYYIISVKISDISTNESFEQKFILREYDYDNFKLSFQAE